MHTLAPCPICGAAPRMGRLTTRSGQPGLYTVFCESTTHSIEVQSAGKANTAKLWNDTMRRTSQTP